MAVYELGDDAPEVDPTAWVAESAIVIGRVTLGPGAKVWPRLPRTTSTTRRATARSCAGSIDRDVGAAEVPLRRAAGARHARAAYRRLARAAAAARRRRRPRAAGARAARRDGGGRRAD